MAFYDRVLARVRTLPGVENAAYASTLPFLSQGNTTSYQIEGKTVEQGQDVVFRTGTTTYPATLGVQLVEGRLPDERDGPGAPLIAVVNQTFARMYWSGESPLG